MPTGSGLNADRQAPRVRAGWTLPTASGTFALAHHHRAEREIWSFYGNGARCHCSDAAHSPRRPHGGFSRDESCSFDRQGGYHSGTGRHHGRVRGRRAPDLDRHAQAPVRPVQRHLGRRLAQHHRDGRRPRVRAHAAPDDPRPGGRPRRRGLRLRAERHAHAQRDRAAGEAQPLRRLRDDGLADLGDPDLRQRLRRRHRRARGEHAERGADPLHAGLQGGQPGLPRPAGSPSSSSARPATRTRTARSAGATPTRSAASSGRPCSTRSRPSGAA